MVYQSGLLSLHEPNCFVETPHFHTSMSEMLTVTLRNQFSELEGLSQILTQFGERHGMNRYAIFSINLALEEIVTNIISYGFDDQEEHAITVRLAFKDQEFTAEVEDAGRPFNPLNAPEPDLEQPLEARPIGGLGVHLAKSMMDRIDYSCVQGKNVLRMTKRIEP